MREESRPLSLTLSKCASVLDGLVLWEVVPLERLKALLKSNLLLMSWDEDYHQLMVEQYANEKIMIGKYYKNYK